MLSRAEKIVVFFIVNNTICFYVGEKCQKTVEWRKKTDQVVLFFARIMKVIKIIAVIIYRWE